jgi:hypothetical protein
MRKASHLVGLTLVALAATAHAQESVPAAAPPAADAATAPGPAQAAVPPRRTEVGLAFMPMALGKFVSAPGGTSVTADAAFGFGVGLSVSYLITHGLSIGFAPQAIFNVKVKDDGGAAAKQYDLMARVAYTLAVVDTIAVYVEVLPGYSLIAPPAGDTAKGLVLAAGVGAAMDVSDRVFANLGVGYQIGFQKLSLDGVEADVRTRYVRVALGGGVKF